MRAAAARGLHTSVPLGGRSPAPSRSKASPREPHSHRSPCHTVGHPAGDTDMWVPSRKLGVESGASLCQPGRKACPYSHDLPWSSWPAHSPSSPCSLSRASAAELLLCMPPSFCHASTPRPMPRPFCLPHQFLPQSLKVTKAAPDLPRRRMWRGEPRALENRDREP